MIKNLEGHMRKQGTDKACPNDRGGHRGYTRYYERMFEPCRDKPVRLVKIGVKDSRSINAWRMYFTKAAHIYGIAYGDSQQAATQACDTYDRTQVVAANAPCSLFKGNQSNKTFLQHFVNITHGAFNIVIDDGSHVPSHRITTFETLWPAVLPGGVYIIEDVETSYWNPNTGIYEYSSRNEVNLVDVWKEMPHVINRGFLSVRAGSNYSHKNVCASVESVEFGQNLIIVRKSHSEDQSLLLKPYRFSNNVKLG
eukprot:gene15236-18020_t